MFLSEFDEIDQNYLLHYSLHKTTVTQTKLILLFDTQTGNDSNIISETKLNLS